MKQHISNIDHLKEQISQCTRCVLHLPHGVNPVFSFDKNSRVALIGQAPGRFVHGSGVPFADKSGDRLINWLGINKSEFYNPALFAIVPMGFCYPGRGKSGDLGPRKECAPLWHQLIFEQLKNIELKILIGKYAQQYYLKNNQTKNLTHNVQNYEDYLPDFFPLPHPSPRNNIWIKRNPWFEKDVLPAMKKIISDLIN